MKAVSRYHICLIHWPSSLFTTPPLHPQGSQDGRSLQQKSARPCITHDRWGFQGIAMGAWRYNDSVFVSVILSLSEIPANLPQMSHLEWWRCHRFGWPCLDGRPRRRRSTLSPGRRLKPPPAPRRPSPSAKRLLLEDLPELRWPAERGRG